MFERVRTWEPTRKESAIILGATHGIMLVIGNIAVTSIIHSEVQDTREFARSDALSHDMSAVASRLAGYPVDAACTYDVAESEQSTFVTLGSVANYKALDPFLIERHVPINPRAIRLHPSICRAILFQSDYPSEQDRRESVARAFMVTLHEITHLDHPTFSENDTQCETIRIMPDQLQSYGFTEEFSEWAVDYANAHAKESQPSSYHESPCSDT